MVGVDDEQTVYDAVGGTPFFADLVERFYARVEVDGVLRPLYPDADLAAAREHLTGFLVQYWGGPTTYSEERGHPRLRMRHAPFAIGPAERDAWYRAMAASVLEVELDVVIERRLLDYFTTAADHMINT
ncbi:MAG: hemoglobin [Acidimicrobiaceae bacterium]|jgi:hemoglobin